MDYIQSGAKCSVVILAVDLVPHAASHRNGFASGRRESRFALANPWVAHKVQTVI